MLTHLFIHSFCVLVSFLTAPMVELPLMQTKVCFTHLTLNKLPYTIYWEDPISTLGISGYVLTKIKMAKLFANSGDPDQMPQNVASDLGLYCLPVPFWGSPD